MNLCLYYPSKVFQEFFFLEKDGYFSILKNFTLFHHKGAIIIFFEFSRQPRKLKGESINQWKFKLFKKHLLMQSMIFESENEYKLPCFVPYILLFEEKNFFLLLFPKQAYPCLWAHNTVLL